MVPSRNVEGQRLHDAGGSCSILSRAREDSADLRTLERRDNRRDTRLIRLPEIDRAFGHDDVLRAVAHRSANGATSAGSFSSPVSVEKP